MWLAANRTTELSFTQSWVFKAYTEEFAPNMSYDTMNCHDQLPMLQHQSHQPDLHPKTDTTYNTQLSSDFIRGQCKRNRKGLNPHLWGCKHSRQYSRPYRQWSVFTKSDITIFFFPQRGHGSLLHVLSLITPPFHITWCAQMTALWPYCPSDSVFS